MNEEGNMSLVKEAISVKSDSFLEINKCLVVGFSSFLALDDKYLTGDNFKKLKIYNTTVDSCTEVITNENLFKAENATNWFTQPDKLVTVSRDGIMNLFKNNDVKKKPDFRLK